MDVFVGDTAAVDGSEYFTDPDGETLTFAASTSDAAVSGSVVRVAAVGAGTAIVTVTATDPGGLSAQTPFGVRSLDDRAVLEALYEAIGGPHWRNNDGWLTDAPIKEWHGVSVDETGRGGFLGSRLQRLELKDSIPPEIGKLANLKSLTLRRSPRTLGSWRTR